MSNDMHRSMNKLSKLYDKRIKLNTEIAKINKKILLENNKYEKALRGEKFV